MRVGPLRLRQELARKGFTEAIICSTVDELFDDESELDVAMKAATKKFHALKPGLEPDIVKRKLYDHLARKGFSSETARMVALDRITTIISTKGK